MFSNEIMARYEVFDINLFNFKQLFFGNNLCVKRKK
jgi:hypothetical protein